MKYDGTIDILKIALNALKDPTVITDKLGITEIFQFPNNIHSNNSMNNNLYEKPENSNIEYNKSVPTKDNGSSNDNDGESDSYYDKQQNTSSNPQGVIDSIAQELTSARLKQAIILSEIVGKPKSKTRRKRRF
jgi:hypothetical protein